ncbi:hypothetical protein TRV_08165 [Trichophyton verrucosum HKI 0517]|uniref:Uncharacterized protein n=1 Tax=Trichophyton verrucosum (strain HKI 0517) TaxID=663202 RepID=D4DLU1_TRIVH|nr:uncharacterized protein TRV_08165 [Trichophyton verrucosum HKI 0517]EFE37184.1 hypothetical protein TRV_08165 [Trichophyton verrucosum HKI 0517]
MHRATERARRSEDRRHIPADGFISSDAGSYSGSSSEIESIRTASSVAYGEDDEDETLRRAFEESLRLEKDRQRQRREAEWEAMLREEEVRRQSLREARAEARRAQWAARAEEAAIRTAMQASEREQEEARARRIRENLCLFQQTVEQSRRENMAGNVRGSRRNLQRLSRDLPSTIPRPRREQGAEAGRNAGQSTTRELTRLSREERGAQAARPRSHRVRDAMRDAVTRSRAFSFGRSSPEWQDSERAVPPYTASSRPSANTTRASNPTRPSNPTSPSNPVGPAQSPRSRSPVAPAGSGDRRRIANPGHYSMLLVTPVDPTNYRVRDVIRRSRREFHARAAATEAGEGFDSDLQRAINESAEQHRDEEEEAVQRSRGIPTYEEACASVRYRPSPGMRYSFQGPEVIEIPRENGPPTKLSIVGDMDLGEAMRIANQRVKRKRGQAQLN